MSLNIPSSKVDFLELAEFGEADDVLYHEFLNLGFQLTATAGSDVPWGDSVGICRTYAYTGGSTDPDDWFRAVRAGRTFVTAGPMLHLTVNGEIPGTVMTADSGGVLHIEASAEGWTANPGYLEVVVQGDVVASAKAAGVNPVGCRIAMDLPVARSMWITARCAGALTSPVYVRVGNQPWWKREIVPQLVANRLSQLAEIEEFAEQVEAGFAANYTSPDRLRRQIPALRERVAAARATYRDLLERSQRDDQLQ